MVSRARRAGAKMEPMLVCQRQNHHFSMDISLHSTLPFYGKSWRKTPAFSMKLPTSIGSIFLPACCARVMVYTKGHLASLQSLKTHFPKRWDIIYVECRKQKTEFSASYAWLVMLIQYTCVQEDIFLKLCKGFLIRVIRNLFMKHVKEN